MSTVMAMSQFPGQSYTTMSSGLSPGMNTGGHPMGQPVPEDQAYLQPTASTSPNMPSRASGTSLSRSTAGSTAERDDSGVVDVDSVNLTDRDSYKIPTPTRSPPVIQTHPEGLGGRSNNLPVLGSKANPHPAVLSAQPGAMRRPDSLAKGHEYEELPTSRYQDPSAYSYAETEGGRPRPHAVDRLASNTGSHSGNSGDSRELLCDSNHNDRLPSPYRKRENPLYDSAERRTIVEEKAKPSICSCPFILLIFFSIVAVLAFLLAALAISGISGDKSARTAALVSPNTQLKEALDRIQALEVQYMALQNKVNSLQDTDIGALQANLSAQAVTIQQLETRVAVYQDSLQNQYKALEANVTQRIDTVSKMPGPPGAGNLTLCQYKKLSVGESSSKQSSVTAYVPDTELSANEWVITGVECSVSGGTFSTLETEKMWNADRFRCQCTGSIVGTSVRYCEIHYWRCPRIS